MTIQFVLFGLQACLVIFQLWLLVISRGQNPVVWGGLAVTSTMLIVTTMILF